MLLGQGRDHFGMICNERRAVDVILNQLGKKLIQHLAVSGLIGNLHSLILAYLSKIRFGQSQRVSADLFGKSRNELNLLPFIGEVELGSHPGNGCYGG